MTTILIWAGLSSLAFTVFFALTIMSILQKRSGLIAAAVAAFIVAIGSGIGAVIMAHSEHLTTPETAPAMRSGNDIYRDLLGAPDVHCVTVSHHRPYIAQAFGRFECVRAFVCPEEVRRVTQQHQCAWRSVPSVDARRPPGDPGTLGDFEPGALGDTIMAHEEPDVRNGRRRWMYCTRDSSSLVVVAWHE